MRRRTVKDGEGEGETEKERKGEWEIKTERCGGGEKERGITIAHAAEPEP